MTYEDFYGKSLDTMKQAEKQLICIVKEFPQNTAEDLNPVLYCSSRIKTPDSMMRKLRGLNLPQDGKTALSEVFDAIGIRIVCAFAEDVYQVVEWLRERAEWEVIREKDYFAYPKPNGYRSYHLRIIIKDECCQGLPAEIQVRTIATDFWASLEHQLKYKKDLEYEKLVRSELKRCADEIASVDLSMQTIRDIIRNEKCEIE